jgi:energy-coupling factor transporter ATP-binding protein EcfA2
MSSFNDTVDLERAFLSLTTNDLPKAREYLQTASREMFTSDERKFIHSMAVRTLDTSNALMTRTIYEHAVGSKVDGSKIPTFIGEWNIIEGTVSQDDPRAILASLNEAVTGRKVLSVSDETLSLLTKGKIQEAISCMRTGIDSLPAAQSSEEFPILRYGDLQSYKPNPVDTLAGEGWIRRGACLMITGGTGDGKSVLVEQLATFLSAGVSFFGITIKQAWRVLHVQVENDIETLQRDFVSIVKHAKGKRGICPVLVHANLKVQHVYGISGKGFATWLESRVKASRPDVIVIDHYSGYAEGDLNSTETFRAWKTPIENMLHEYGCALVLVAHTPKPRDRESYTARQSAYLAAGSSAISNWARTSAELTGNGPDGCYRLRFGKNAERTGLQKPTGAVLRDLYVKHSGDRHNPYWILSDDQVEAPKGKYASEISQAISENPQDSYREIAKKVGCSPASVCRHLKQLPNSDSSAFHVSFPPKGGETKKHDPVNVSETRKKRNETHETKNETATSIESLEAIPREAIPSEVSQ